MQCRIGAPGFVIVPSARGLGDHEWCSWIVEALRHRDDCARARRSRSRSAARSHAGELQTFGSRVRVQRLYGVAWLEHTLAVVPKPDRREERTAAVRIKLRKDAVRRRIARATCAPLVVGVLALTAIASGGEQTLHERPVAAAQPMPGVSSSVEAFVNKPPLFARLGEQLNVRGVVAASVQDPRLLIKSTSGEFALKMQKSGESVATTLDSARLGKGDAQYTIADGTTSISPTYVVRVFADETVVKVADGMSVQRRTLGALVWGTEPNHAHRLISKGDGDVVIPNSFAVDRDRGTAYVLDPASQSVHRLEMATSQVTTQPLKGGYPMDLTVDPSTGDVFVVASDRSITRLRQPDGSPSALSVRQVPPAAMIHVDAAGVFLRERTQGTETLVSDRELSAVSATGQKRTGASDRNGTATVNLEVSGSSVRIGLTGPRGSLTAVEMGRRVLEATNPVITDDGNVWTIVGVLEGDGTARQMLMRLDVGGAAQTLPINTIKVGALDRRLVAYGADVALLNADENGVQIEAISFRNAS